MARPLAIDEENAREGLLGLVVALVEIVHEVLKLQAIRRMDRGALGEEELDRVGRTLLAIERGLAELKRDQGLGETVAAIRADLDDLVDHLLDPVPDLVPRE